MIEIFENKIHLKNDVFSYAIAISDLGHLHHLYFGSPILSSDCEALIESHFVSYGSSIVLGQDYSLDQIAQEISFKGKGDFRESSYEVVGSNNEFVSHLRVSKTYLNELIEFPKDFFYPRTNEQVEQLVIEMIDDYHPVLIKLFYTLYPTVLVRHISITNHSNESLYIKKLMSAQFDVITQHCETITLNGTWGKEAQIKHDIVTSGSLVHQSLTGATSSLTNSGLMVKTDQMVYGLNLIYSGNHYNSVSKHYDGSARIMMGINPSQFSVELLVHDTFESPCCVLTCSQEVYRVSNQFHNFIKDYLLVPAPFEKPVTYNHWEGTFFDYNHSKLLKFASKAKDCDMDLFVIDDGWFGHRDQDNNSLGDYFENSKKFPYGLSNTLDKIRSLGLKVGLWVEPEMISEDSELFRTRPHFAVGDPNHTRAKGRNQLVLDLCQKEVQDFIIKEVTRVIDQYGVDYIKWDMNRHHSDQFSIALENQYLFDVTYQKGLVRVLREIFNPRPHVFLEMCSSGGNRFDLGMLCVAQQIWTSDNTDAMDRLKIQEGTSMFYPLTCISNHVSGKVNAQTLRQNPLSTRFNVACFGALGYELDLSICSKVELDEIKEQIQFYKAHKDIILNGEFRVMHHPHTNRVCWQVIDKNQGIVGLFGLMNQALSEKELLVVKDLKQETKYKVLAKSQKLNLERFGELLKHVTNLPIHPYGSIMNTVSHYKSMDDGPFEKIASGALLEAGLPLNPVYLGTGYHDKIRIWGDFGSTLYTIKEVNHE